LARSSKPREGDARVAEPLLRGEGGERKGGGREQGAVRKDQVGTGERRERFPPPTQLSGGGRVTTNRNSKLTTPGLEAGARGVDLAEFRRALAARGGGGGGWSGPFPTSRGGSSVLTDFRMTVGGEAAPGGPGATSKGAKGAVPKAGLDGRYCSPAPPRGHAKSSSPTAKRGPAPDRVRAEQARVAPERRARVASRWGLQFSVDWGVFRGSPFKDRRARPVAPRPGDRDSSSSGL